MALRRRGEIPKGLDNMKRLLLLVVAIVLCTSFEVYGQSSPTPTPTPSLEKEFFKNILRDQKAIWTAPAHLERSDIKWVAISGIGLGALISTDRITGDKIAEHDGAVKLSRAISQIGATYTLGAAAATFYIVGRHTENQRARETGVLSAESLLDAMIVGGSLKAITQRTRPDGGEDRSEFFHGGDSFPSGHAIQVWSVATVVANEYPNRRLVQVISYGLATAVSIARVTAHRHYISDVVVGSALGYGIGHYVYKAHHRESSSGGDSEDRGELRWPVIMPIVNSQARQYGVALTWSFKK